MTPSVATTPVVPINQLPLPGPAGLLPDPGVGRRRNRVAREAFVLLDVVVVLGIFASRGGGGAEAIVALSMLVAARTGEPRALPMQLVTLERIGHLWGRMGVAVLLVVPGAIQAQQPTRVLNTAFTTAVLLVLARATLGAIVVALRRRGIVQERTLIVGADATSLDIAAAIRHEPGLGMSLVAVIDDPTVEQPDAPVGIEDLPALVDALSLDRVIVGPGGTDDVHRVPTLRSALGHGVVLHLVPNLSVLAPVPARPTVDLIEGVPVYQLGPAVPSGLTWQLKRLVDIAIAGALLVVLTPLLVLSAIGTAIALGRPVLFRQERIGRDGHPFPMLKFRTYPVDHIDATLSLPDDDCPVAFGRFLRKSSIDELPQLWNVLLGQMSVVGPRPERTRFAAELAESVPGYADRHRVRTGLTGLAQVSRRWTVAPIPERARLDNRYIDSWSFWSDLVILAKTLPAVVRKARGGRGG